MCVCALSTCSSISWYNTVQREGYRKWGQGWLERRDGRGERREGGREGGGGMRGGKEGERESVMEGRREGGREGGRMGGREKKEEGSEGGTCRGEEGKKKRSGSAPTHPFAGCPGTVDPSLPSPPMQSAPGSG